MLLLSLTVYDKIQKKITQYPMQRELSEHDQGKTVQVILHYQNGVYRMLARQEQAGVFQYPARYASKQKTHLLIVSDQQGNELSRQAVRLHGATKYDYFASGQLSGGTGKILNQEFAVRYSAQGYDSNLQVYALPETEELVHDLSTVEVAALELTQSLAIR